MANANALKPSFFSLKRFSLRRFSLKRFSFKRWQKWFRTAKSDNNIAVLNARQIYILPTRWGVLFAIMLVLLLVGSINYSISLGYYVTFLLASLGHTAMLHTWRNLAYLQVTTLPAKPVFAGDLAQLSLQIADTKNRDRYAVVAQFEDNDASSYDIAKSAAQTFTLPLQTHKRGWLTLPRIKLYTEFPLSLLHAWAYVEGAQQLLAYPKPSDSNVPPPISSSGQSHGKNYSARGDEDFDGHKTYQIGDAPSRVDWKASSRGIGMFSKQYSGNGSAVLLLDWQMTAGLEHEERIALLTKWVIEAHAAKQPFSLNIPSTNLPPDASDAHYHQALRELALM